MKKTWVALAVAGTFAGAAHAQSSVTLYGIADANVQWRQSKVDGINDTIGIESGHQSGSRWGLRGSEDLGGGLSAIFTLEGGYNIDTGTLGQGGRIFGRQAWVGLRGGFGSVVLGRVATLSSGTGSFDMFGSVDPFATGFGGLNLVFTSANAQRNDNSILWQSNKLGPVQVGAMYTTQVNGAEVPGWGANTRMAGVAVNGTFGPVFVSVTYDKFYNPVPNRSDEKRLQVGAKATFGAFGVHAAYAKEDDRFLGGGAVPITNGADADAYMVGLSAKIGSAGTLLASYQKYDGDNNGLTNEPGGRDLQRWGIAYTHSLSRRTNLYASYGDNDGEEFLNNNPAFSYRQVTLGVRHLF